MVLNSLTQYLILLGPIQDPSSSILQNVEDLAEGFLTSAFAGPILSPTNLETSAMLITCALLGEGTGLLRLHSTYCHDLKIYSSDDGRVQMSVAAFAKGLLDLEGQLISILVSLVSKDSSMLDGLEDGNIEMKEAKAQLNEIIISSANPADSNGSPEFPWMVDGVGLPPNASELLAKLVMLTKKVTEQVRLHAKGENEKLTERSIYDAIPPYDQAKALGKTNIDVGRIAAGLPCGSEGFLLMYVRWKKLKRDLYNERQQCFGITQIPDVYDSCKCNLLNNAHLNLEGLDELFRVARALADGVIPNEYGINPKQKLKIGSKIARPLLGKHLIDLRNTQEEAISVAELKNNQDHSLSMKTKKEDAEAKLKYFHKNDEVDQFSKFNPQLMTMNFLHQDLVRQLKDQLDNTVMRCHLLVSVDFVGWRTLNLWFHRIEEGMVNDRPIKVKYCVTYMLYCPLCGLHCHVCNHGAGRLDHHCPGVDQCIGLRNNRDLYWFVSSCIYVCSISVVYIKVSIDHNYETVWKSVKESSASDILMACCFVFWWFAGNKFLEGY